MFYWTHQKSASLFFNRQNVYDLSMSFLQQQQRRAQIRHQYFRCAHKTSQKQTTRKKGNETKASLKWKYQCENIKTKKMVLLLWTKKGIVSLSFLTKYEYINKQLKNSQIPIVHIRLYLSHFFSTVLYLLSLLKQTNKYFLLLFIQFL